MARKKPIDNVTVERLHAVLLICNIDVKKDMLDKIIDIVELIEVRAGETSLEDIDKLKESWKENNNIHIGGDISYGVSDWGILTRR